MGQPTTPKALALGVSLSLACGLMPAAAFAEEAPATDDGATSTATDPSTEAAPQPSGYDKAEFYSDSSAGALLARSIAAPLALSYQPVSVSDEMKYFAKYESGRNYDQGLSSGDGYHAMGFYQFDNRYVLAGFLTSCYQYDPVTYAMFGWVSGTDITGDLYDKSSGSLTETGKRLNDSWHAAYAADPSGFSSLQDSYAYTTYYLPAETYLRSQGIDISSRADCAKGLCWGLSSLFGPGGWKKFVGGVSDGYDWNGTYHYLSERYEWPGAGLSNDMTDREFVTTLCNYVVDNVSVFYAGQPEYHQGWENRYKKEKELGDCLVYIEEDERNEAASDPVVPEPAPAPTPTPAPDPVVPGEDPEEPSENAPGPEVSTESTVDPGQDGSSNGSANGSNSSSNEGAIDGLTPNGSDSNEAASGGADTNGTPDGGSDANNGSNSNGSGSNEEANGVPNGGSSSNEATGDGSGTVPTPSEGSESSSGENGTDAETGGEGSPDGQEPEGGTEQAGTDDTKAPEVVDADAKELNEPHDQGLQELPKQDGEQTGQGSQPEQTSGGDSADPQATSEKSGLTQTGDNATRGPLGAALVSACVAAVAGAALSMRRLLKRP